MLKQKRITLHQALKAIEVYRRIPVRPVEVELEVSLKTAAELNIYAYDAYLLRCAIKYNAPLISLDKNLIELAQGIGVETIEVEQ
jgi:predicted nucleic acid-binding protein